MMEGCWAPGRPAEGNTLHIKSEVCFKSPTIKISLCFCHLLVNWLYDNKLTLSKKKTASMCFSIKSTPQTEKFCEPLQEEKIELNGIDSLSIRGLFSDWIKELQYLVYNGLESRDLVTPGFSLTILKVVNLIFRKLGGQVIRENIPCWHNACSAGYRIHSWPGKPWACFSPCFPVSLHCPIKIKAKNLPNLLWYNNQRQSL